MKHLRSSILAFVLAGGVGKRLYPLTLERTKPSVPFGGKYRIIDFALSNLINSGVYSIYVPVQYKSQSLIEHLRTTWRKSGVLSKHFITVVPPQMRREEIQAWYRGTADSVYQNINLIYDFKPKIVAIFGGDHIYRMNIKQMIDFHIKNKAHLTVSTTPIESKDASEFGIVQLDGSLRIKDFKEKPEMSGKSQVFASMGNYIFNADVLVETLEEMIEKTTAHDFGRDIIPYLIRKKTRVFGYDFSKNAIPSLKKHEERGYWRDVGTIESYWKANMDLLGRRPKLDLTNHSWPVYGSSVDLPPAYTVGSDIDNSLVTAGVRVYGAKIKNSIIGRGVILEEGCKIEDSIIMDFAVIGKNCKIKRTIVDRYNTIKRNTRIGFNKESDAKKYFLDPSGIVVVKRGARKIFY
ncbi:MAG: glucose-1-phosphate adenylyltransferase [Candidatus Omnitrophica bacterium]|nr:glucose-1-phosphate adenylyltransferase [Candidatus Omnitrophota bacterium]